MPAVPQASADGPHILELGRAEAPPVVLLHGLGALAEEILLPLREGLLELGLQVLAVDRPGYGRSPPLPDQPGPAAQARWLAGALQSRRVVRPLVIAHSFGAAVALWLAAEFDRGVAGLLLVNPFCRPTRASAVPLMRLATAPVVGSPVRRRLAPAIATGLVRWGLINACAPDPLPPRLASLPCRMMTQESALLAMAAELKAFNHDMLCLPRESIRARGLALTGAGDRIIEGERHGDWLAARFGFERRSLDGGHMLHQTRTPDVLAATRELLAA